ncbi:hypothetical protein PEX2_028330 [Penicillium expansum]|uniref:Uncharacterized protein n=1 Tax=Penicillium expansum TaxID=27334 RepID=A0A0A2J6H1_PENEN|nr:hypothetical protein PEX2_028330 [Penicillium expansum]KGO50268.1 hypothetical protein PEX2_028330 [Penicillium expansum]
MGLTPRIHICLPRGPVTVIYGTIVALVVYFMVALSLAELPACIPLLAASIILPLY